MLGTLDQMQQLAAHNISTTDGAANRGFINNGPQAWPVVTRQDLLPGHADFNEAFYLVAIELTRAGADHRAGVVGSLERTRYDDGLEVAG